jgi:hypothetical protein
MKHSCGSCAAASYENGDGELEARKEYHAERRQCGWTTAKLLVSEYWYQKTGTTNVADLHDKTLCYCASCVRDRMKADKLKLELGASNEVIADSQFYSA